MGVEGEGRKKSADWLLGAGRSGPPNPQVGVGSLKKVLVTTYTEATGRGESKRIPGVGSRIALRHFLVAWHGGRDSFSLEKQRGKLGDFKGVMKIPRNLYFPF